jgi:hypothetical protein
MTNPPPKWGRSGPNYRDEWGVYLDHGPIIPVPDKGQAVTLAQSVEGYRVARRSVGEWKTV